MKKHMLPLLLAAFFALSLAACNTQETGSSSRLEAPRRAASFPPRPVRALPKWRRRPPAQMPEKGTASPPPRRRRCCRLPWAGNLPGGLGGHCRRPGDCIHAAHLPGDGGPKRCGEMLRPPQRLARGGGGLFHCSSGPACVGGHRRAAAVLSGVSAGGSYTPLATLRETEGLAQALAGRAWR